MAVVINGTTGITSVNGSAAAPSVTGTDTDTGIVYGTNTLSLATGGTTAVFVDASQNVGVNTNSPKTRLSGNVLSINGTLPTGYQAGIELLNNGASAGEIWCNATEMVIGSYAGSPLSFRVNNDIQMQLVIGGNFKFNSGYGSVATAYGCRAWVNFQGTGTVTIRGSGNVSSVTDNGVGDYTPNFTTALPDTNYSVAYAFSRTGLPLIINAFSYLTTSLRFQCMIYDTTNNDSDIVSISIFR